MHPRCEMFIVSTAPETRDPKNNGQPTIANVCIGAQDTMPEAALCKQHSLNPDTPSWPEYRLAGGSTVALMQQVEDGIPCIPFNLGFWNLMSNVAMAPRFIV